MTARDEAIDAMRNIAQNFYNSEVWATEIAEMLDGIPGPVLAKLAIERGALTPCLSSFWKNVYRLVDDSQ